MRLQLYTDEQMFAIGGGDMVLGQWKALADSRGQALSSDLPVLFYHAGRQPLSPGDYCTGTEVHPSYFWDGEKGWQPCVIVELDAPF